MTCATLLTCKPREATSVATSTRNLPFFESAEGAGALGLRTITMDHRRREPVMHQVLSQALGSMFGASKDQGLALFRHREAGAEPSTSPLEPPFSPKDGGSFFSAP